MASTSIVVIARTQAQVSLLNIEGVCVGEGCLSTVQAGRVLHTRALQEDEVAVYITKIIDESYTVREPFQELLSECGSSFIRWKSQYVHLLLDDVERSASTSDTSQKY
jgi:hypothetical protein